MVSIGVTIPVGASESNRRWLTECLNSVLSQTRRPDSVTLVWDYPNDKRLPWEADQAIETLQDATLLKEWTAPWYLGVAHAFNFGVALDPSEMTLMLGSDDTLEPDCLEECASAYYAWKRNPLAYYYLGVRYMDDDSLQTVPCNAAMVGKALWRRTGGFPVESASGAPDAALVSILLSRGIEAGYVYPVADGKPLYNYRRHQDTDTASRGPWQGVILATRDILTTLWKPKEL